jgi:glycerophosphoryl diester phosphodiesterase
MKLRSIIIENLGIDARIHYILHIWVGVFHELGWVSDSDIADFGESYGFVKYNPDSHEYATDESWRGDQHPDENLGHGIEFDDQGLKSTNDVHPLFIELLSKLPNRAWVEAIKEHLHLVDKNNQFVDVLFRNLKIIDLEDDNTGLLKVSCLMDVNLAQFIEMRTQQEHDGPEDLATDGTAYDGFKIVRSLK